MAYIIYNNDGTILLNLTNGQIDSVTTSLDLIGKNVDNYGQYFNNNLVRLLTSFAAPDSSSPRSPQIGQLWFNTTTKKLTVFDGASFKPTYGATVSGTAALTTSTGDLWYDTINSQLKIWNGSAYKLVGPAVSGILGKFGVDLPSTTIREDDTYLPQKVGLLYSYGSPMAMITTSSFSMSAADGTTYLNSGTTSTIVKGITIPNNLDVRDTLYINGIRQVTPIQTLTAYFDITTYGDPASATTATAISNIAAGNVAISDHLALLFTTSTNAAYSEVAYPIGSDARVVCYFNTTPSVRRFHLIEDPLHLGTNMWRWWDLYYSSTLSTVTNIVVH